MPYNEYKESRFPHTYRQTELKAIMQAIQTERSCMVIGTAGMGKSNLIRFLAANPDVREKYLSNPDDYLLVYVDVNRATSQEELYQILCAELIREGQLLYTIPSVLAEPAGRSLLMEIVNGLGAKHLVCVIDPFDNAAKFVNPGFYSFLRALRDTTKRVSYIFGLRRPLALKVLGELAELMVSPCWVGPLSCEDALGSIQRDETRLRIIFAEKQREALLQHSGCHPGFLKNSCELLAMGKLDITTPEECITEQLNAYLPISQLCRELRDDLSEEECSVLWQIAANETKNASDSKKHYYPEPESSVYVQASAYLKNIGLVTASDRIFSPLFREFVINNTPRQITIDANTGEIRQGYEIIDLPLTSLPGKLLKHLVDNAGRRISIQELDRVVYGMEGLGQAMIMDLLGLAEELRDDIQAVYDLLDNKREARARLNVCLEEGRHMIEKIKELSVPDPDGAKRLHTLVFRLRRHLGANVIHGNADGYLFKQPDECVTY